jgi:iron complex transport system substrate-binding protein
MNPDVIITNVDYIDDAVGVIKSSEGWENVTAIQNDAVYYIDANASNQPNNHVIDALIQMAKYVYPDEYADFEDPFATATDAE